LFAQRIQQAQRNGRAGRERADRNCLTAQTTALWIRVAESVRDGYYPLVLTTKAGKGERTFMLLIAVGEAAG
jgi:hypothetical protein